jgi:hypothetical protein
MADRRMIDTYSFGYHVYTLTVAVVVAAVVGLLAHAPAAALLTLGAGLVGFLLAATTVGASEPRPVAHSRSLRRLVRIVVALAVLLSATTAVQVKTGDHHAAWGTAIASLAALLIGVVAVLSASFERRTSTRDVTD